MTDRTGCVSATADTGSSALTVSVERILVSECGTLNYVVVSAGATLLLKSAGLGTGSGLIYGGHVVVTVCGIVNACNKHGAAILTCTVGICAVSCLGTGRKNLGLAANDVAESGDRGSGTDYTAITRVNSIAVVCTGGKNLLAENVVNVLVLGIELVVAVSGITERDVVDHKTAAVSIGITGEVDTLDTVARGGKRNSHGASVHTVDVVVKAYGIGSIVKHDADVYVEPAGEEIVNRGKAGNVLLEENKTGSRGVTVVDSKDLDNALLGCLAVRIIGDIDLGNGSKNEEVLDNVLGGPAAALYEGKAEVLVHIGVHTEGKEAYCSIRGGESGEAASLHGKPKLNLGRICLTAGLKVGVLNLDKGEVAVAIIIGLDSGKVGSSAVSILVSLIAAEAIVDGNHHLVGRTVEVEVLVGGGEAHVTAATGVAEAGGSTLEGKLMYKLLSLCRSAKGTGRGSKTGCGSECGIGCAGKGVVVSRSCSILFTADPTGSGGGTGGIEELVLDILLTELTLCIRVVAGSTCGILVVNLSLRSGDVLGAKLTGVGCDTVGLTLCEGQAGRRVGGILSLYVAVGGNVSVIVVGVTLMSDGVDNELRLGCGAAEFTNLTGSKTGGGASCRSAGNGNLVALMLNSGNNGNTGLYVATARALSARCITNGSTGSRLLGNLNVVVAESGILLGETACATLGIGSTGGCGPGVIGNVTVGNAASGTGLSSSSETACLSPLVTESLLPIGGGKSTNRALLRSGTGCRRSLVCKSCTFFSSARCTGLCRLTGGLGPLFMLTFFAASSKGNQKEY